MKTNLSATKARARRVGRTDIPLIIWAIVPCAVLGLAAGKLLAGKSNAHTPQPQATPTAQKTASAQPAATSALPEATAPIQDAAEEGAPVANAPDDMGSGGGGPKVIQVTPAPKPSKPPAPPAQTVQEQQIKFGTSVKGRPLIAYVLGDGPNVTFIFGAFHGNEASTPGVVTSLRAYLKQNPKYLTGSRVVLAPVVNPDGLRAGTRVNANGVDINRNFPGTWKPAAAKARYNPGPSPESEPETKAVIELMKTYNPAKVISLHQPFHTMNWTGEKSRILADVMHKYNHYSTTGDIGYPTPGSYGDYCGLVKKIAIITLELSNDSAEVGWRENQGALLAAILHHT